MLIVILYTCRSEIGTEQFDECIFGIGTPKLHRIVIGAQHAMHAGAVLHGGGDLAGNSPFTFELELERTGVVACHRGRAQSGAEVEGRREQKPLTS